MQPFRHFTSLKYAAIAASTMLVACLSLNANAQALRTLIERLRRQVQIAVELEIPRSTMHSWAEQHEEFSAALTRAKECEQAWWEQQGMSGMVGDKFNAAVWRTSMQARFRDDYTERKEISGPDGKAIELETKPSEALKAFLSAKSG